MNNFEIKPKKSFQGEIERFSNLPNHLLDFRKKIGLFQSILEIETTTSKNSGIDYEELGRFKQLFENLNLGQNYYNAKTLESMDVKKRENLRDLLLTANTIKNFFSAYESTIPDYFYNPCRDFPVVLPREHCRKV